MTKDTDLAFSNGAWLGKDSTTDEHAVANSMGAVHTRTVKRMAATMHHVPEMLDGFSALPWNEPDTEFKVSPQLLPGAVDGGPQVLEPNEEMEETEPVKQGASAPL